MLDINSTNNIFNELVTYSINANINLVNLSHFKMSIDCLNKDDLTQNVEKVPAPVNIYQLKQIPSSANTHIGNFYHVIVEQNTVKADISWWLYLSYTHQAPKLQRFTKDTNINFGNITCHFFFRKTVFACGKLPLNIGYYSHIYYSK